MFLEVVHENWDEITFRPRITISSVSCLEIHAASHEEDDILTTGPRSQDPLHGYDMENRPIPRIRGKDHFLGEPVVLKQCKSFFGDRTNVEGCETKEDN